jgi:hypothetical protein
MVYFSVANDFYYDVLKWESDDLRRALGDIILLIVYSVFFALMTQAFMLLGMLEYFSAKVTPSNQADTAVGWKNYNQVWCLRTFHIQTTAMFCDSDQ